MKHAITLGKANISSSAVLCDHAFGRNDKHCASLDGTIKPPTRYYASCSDDITSINHLFNSPFANDAKWFAGIGLKVEMAWRLRTFKTRREKAVIRFWRGGVEISGRCSSLQPRVIIAWVGLLRLGDNAKISSLDFLSVDVLKLYKIILDKMLGFHEHVHCVISLWRC